MVQFHTFYNGLRDATRTVIDALAGGALMKKTTDQSYEILEDTTTNSNQWPQAYTEKECERCRQRGPQSFG